MVLVFARVAGGARAAGGARSAGGAWAAGDAPGGGPGGGAYAGGAYVGTDTPFVSMSAILIAELLVLRDVERRRYRGDLIIALAGRGVNDAFAHGWVVRHEG